jgi:TetR/AcrR family transcriptional regulator of autoinduction and epiphytic fitness
VYSCFTRAHSNIDYDTMAIMPVKTRSGATRRRNPAETRRRILEAARGLFSEQGYASTTLAAIAARAGVAVQTVYFTFHTKGELLMQVVLAAGADDPAAPRHEDRGWYREMLASTDARRQLALLSEHGTDIFVRVAPLIGFVEAARAGDATLDTAWQQTVMARRDALREQVEVVARNGALRPELGVDDAADIVYVLQRPETLRALTTECGWSIKRYKAWLYRTLCDQLLADGPGSASDATVATAGLSFAVDIVRSGAAPD